ncbi:MAG: coiled-coil domain-containing protein [Candidatus Hermodarchaeota archaeon]
MNCKRALEILKSIKNRVDIPCSSDEISDLLKLSFISEYGKERTILPKDGEINTLKINYDRLNNEIHGLNKELLSLEREFERVSLGSKLVSYLQIGKGKKLKSQISKMKNEINKLDTQVSIIKDQILYLNDQKHSINQAVQVNGKNVILTPIGDNMIDEIEARERFLLRDLTELNSLIEQLDEEFSSLIDKVGVIMKTGMFSAIWAVYLLNSNLTKLENAFNSISQREYTYSQAEKRMMTLSINFMRNPQLNKPDTSRGVLKIERSMQHEYGKDNPANEIRESLFKYGLKQKIIKAILMIGKLFSNWSLHHGNKALGDEYVTKLIKVFKDQPIGSLSNEEVVYASFIIPFIGDLSKLNYFNDLLRDIPEGSKFFASVSALFPWDVKETWMILLRAEMNILRAQSAKFIPELIEYALILAMNPKIIRIENSFSQSQYDEWIQLIIPIVHLLAYTFLEKDLEKYVRTRPLAYIISPRYYHRSSLHYHVIG